MSNTLKKIFTSSPVLYSPSKMDKFVLETDASDLGLGDCLKANNSQGTIVVGYCSDKFVINECNWNIVEKKAFSVLYGVRHFHHYLMGCKFVIKCNNRVETRIN